MGKQVQITKPKGSVKTAPVPLDQRTPSGKPMRV